MGTPETVRNQDEQDVVVLVDCAGGSELEGVRDALTDSLDTPTVLVKRADLGAVSIALDLATGLLEVDGRQVRPAVVWIRHASASAMVAQAQPPGSMKPLAAASWSILIHQLVGPGTAALPGTAPTGPGQLLDAERLGIKTPQTVLTTNVAAAARRLSARRIIVKTPDFRLVEPDHRDWPAALPAIVDRAAALSHPVVGERPVVVQEYVAHTRELRVFYLNEALCAFEVHQAEPATMWTDPDSVTVTKVDCPSAAADAVRTLCAAWKLRFGAFDLLISERGEPVFLEVNPDGDWLWYERKARWCGVSFMAAVMVRELFVRGVSARVQTTDHDGGCEVVSAREALLVAMLARGYTTDRAARELKLSRHTVGELISVLLERFDCSNRAALVAYCYVHRVLPLGVWPPPCCHPSADGPIDPILHTQG